jgi:putative membrane-bound dehydrogenase-like protein
MRAGHSVLLLCLLCIAATPFPTPFDSEESKEKPLSAKEAAARMSAPEGLHISVFASEPDIRNPIASAWDHKGRLWVAENFTYAEHPKRLEPKLRDRIVVFPAHTADTPAPKPAVFTDALQGLTGIEVAQNGVWAICPPKLLFIPDRDNDDQPDSEPETILDGFTVARDSHHNFANGIRFGPDGWLYGRCGGSCPGRIGAPGTPDASRVPLNGGIWRFNTRTRAFEVLCHGTTNPWGHDWNDLNDLFFINTVNGHFWHMIPGAHFTRPFLLDPNPHIYKQIDHHADHFHFDTQQGWTKSRDGAANDLGGGHAHTGLLIPQGDQWPASLRSKVLTLNLHGKRTNVESLENAGSGYVAKHQPDTFIAADPFFRGIDLQQGPDGAAYLLDWSDTGECHERTGVHRNSGRIYRIAPSHLRNAALPDLSSTTPELLLEHLRSPDAWLNRHAATAITRIPPSLLRDTVRLLSSTVRYSRSEPIRIRALLALHRLGALAQNPTVSLKKLLSDPSPELRVWAVRLLTDHLPMDLVSGERPKDAPAVTGEIAPLLRAAAEKESSPRVRLALASALQRLPVGERVSVARELLKHSEDASDHNLPLMLWYALIPVANTLPNALPDLAAACEVPLTLEALSWRAGSLHLEKPGVVDPLLAQLALKPQPLLEASLRGLREAMKGIRQTARPSTWSAFELACKNLVSDESKQSLRELAAVFGEGRALEEIRAVALDAKAPIDSRRNALQTLIDQQDPDLITACEPLLNTRHLQTTAIRGLATLSEFAPAGKVASTIRKVHTLERAEALSAALVRKDFAEAVLSEIEAGRLDPSELSAFHLRQIRDLRDEPLLSKLTKLRPDAATDPSARQAKYAELRALLTPSFLAKANLEQGRLAFTAACGACHQMFGQGGKLGPDLTGSDRRNLDYLLENILNPSGAVAPEYQTARVKMKDGRLLTGIIAGRDARKVRLNTIGGVQDLDAESVESITPSRESLMPEGLLSGLPKELLRDLFGFLMQP